jgi:O-antigen ligase
MKKYLLGFSLLLLPFGELLRFRIFNEITISVIDILVGVLFFFTIFDLLCEKKLPVFGKPFFIFFSLGILSLIANAYWLTFFQLFSSFLYLLRFIVYVSIALNIKKILEKKLLYFCLFSSGILFIVFGFIQFFFYPNLINLYYLGWDTHWYRLFSTFFDPNFAGIFICLFLLFALYVLLNTRKHIFIFPLGILIFISLVALLLTFSRSAILSLAVGIITYIVCFKKSRNAGLILLISICIGVIIITYNYKATEGTKLFRISSTTSRFSSFEESLFIFQKHPLLGVGFDTYRYAQYRYGFAKHTNWETSHSGAGVENSFLFILVTTGILGFLSFCYFLYRIFQYMIREQKNMYATFVIASFLSVICNSFFVNTFFYPSIMLWLWSIFSLL